MREYYVYILTNRSRTLYVGVTNDLERRVHEHKHKLVPGFTSKYNITRLVWYEAFERIDDAIEGEKRIKGWLRSKKIALIESVNPTWRDLSEGWYRDQTTASANVPNHSAPDDVPLGSGVAPRAEDSSLRSE